jgi:hypothetical protein
MIQKVYELEFIIGLSFDATRLQMCGSSSELIRKPQWSKGHHLKLREGSDAPPQLILTVSRPSFASPYFSKAWAAIVSMVFLPLNIRLLNVHTSISRKDAHPLTLGKESSRIGGDV